MRRRWFAPPPLGGRQLWIMAEIAEISDWKMSHNRHPLGALGFRRWRDDSRTGVYFALDSVSKKRDVTHARIDAAVPKSSARASTRHTRRRLAQDEHQHDVLHGRHDLGDAHGGRPPQRPRDSRRGGARDRVPGHERHEQRVSGPALRGCVSFAISPLGVPEAEASARARARWGAGSRVTKRGGIRPTTSLRLGVVPSPRRRLPAPRASRPAFRRFQGFGV